MILLAAIAALGITFLVYIFENDDDEDDDDQDGEGIVSGWGF